MYGFLCFRKAKRPPINAVAVSANFDGNQVSHNNHSLSTWEWFAKKLEATDGLRLATGESRCKAISTSKDTRLALEAGGRAQDEALAAERETSKERQEEIRGMVTDRGSLLYQGKEFLDKVRRRKLETEETNKALVKINYDFQVKLEQLRLEIARFDDLNRALQLQMQKLETISTTGIMTAPANSSEVEEREGPSVMAANARIADGIVDAGNQELGTGGMGLVMACKIRISVESEHHANCAAKLFNHRGFWPESVKENAERFRREAGRIRKMKHVNIIRLLDFAENSDGLNQTMVLERMEGDLTEFAKITTDDAVADKVRFQILYEISQGLEYIHSLERPLCHLDVKPGNIGWVRKRLQSGAMGYRFVLMDFDSSEEEGEDVDGYSMTPFYTAPEIAAKSGRHSTKSDIYSLFITMLALVNYDDMWEKMLDISKEREFWQDIKYLTEDDEGISDWGDMGALCPDFRPSASTIVQRCRFITKLDRDNWTIEPRDRDARNRQLANYIRSQPADVQSTFEECHERLAFQCRPHQRLLEQGDLADSDIQ